ncbi:MAG: 2-C-methyl-D-erythritol 4-phosphate cytidylyltransferase [Oscillospiraceae bacterium]|nr:2-C-methyl-D-erythritol 4-phosphate cytidylyltransferase [Oscillospiraceae bacterium]
MSGIISAIKKIRGGFCSCIVLAAGSSSRMGSDKLFEDIDGRPAVYRALLALDRCEAINEIIVVTSKENLEKLSELIAGNFEKVRRIITGGETRLESGIAGCGEVSSKADVIMFHDGARPLVTPELCEKVIHAARLHNAAVPAVPVSDTIKIMKDGFAVEIPDRSTLYAVQTPQCFEANLIKGALTDAFRKGLAVTDDASAVEALGVKPAIVPGEPSNIKLTVPEDLPKVRALYFQNKETENKSR